MPGPTGPTAAEAARSAPIREDDDAWRRGLAQKLDRLGLRSSARLLLDSAQPISWLGAQALWLAQPVASLAGLGAGVARWARTLESDTEFAALLAALDPSPPEESV